MKAECSNFRPELFPAGFLENMWEIELVLPLSVLHLLRGVGSNAFLCYWIKHSIIPSPNELSERNPDGINWVLQPVFFNLRIHSKTDLCTEMCSVTPIQTYETLFPMYISNSKFGYV